jgi:colanic acid biosynthesis protein WcaH
MHDALHLISELAGDPRAGLPEELFLFISSITPMVNVDLLVRDDAGRILLSWRDDALCGTGWHVPGGVVRFQETLTERVRKTALLELGCEVVVTDPTPEFVEFIRPDGPRERSHFVTFLYHCMLPAELETPPRNRPRGEAGHLAFHAAFPENMIPVHHVYRRCFRS